MWVVLRPLRHLGKVPIKEKRKKDWWAAGHREHSAKWCRDKGRQQEIEPEPEQERE